MSSPTQNPPPPAAVHVDLDGAAEIFRVHGWNARFERDPLFESGLTRLLELFDSLGVRATLFVIEGALDDPPRRELIEEAVRRGHGIASHSRTHRPLSTLDAQSRRAEIADSRARLEDRLGVAVEGFRAPNFDLDREGLELIAEAGYRYDSSLFPTTACARRLGLEAVPPTPSRPLPGSGLVELPLPPHAPMPFPFHPCYSLALGGWYFRTGLARVRRRGLPLVLLFHLTDLADPLPDELLQGAPRWKARFFTLSHLRAETKLARCRAFLEAVGRDFRPVPTEELVASCGGSPA